MPKGPAMASYDPGFRLDTAAFNQARRTRTTRTSLYWLVLIMAACLVAAGFAVMASRMLNPAPAGHAQGRAALPPPPPPSHTRVAVWNVHGAPGAAGLAAATLAKAGYPVAGTRNTRSRRLRGTWIMYAPGAESPAHGVAAELGLNPKRVAPLDGVEPKSIAPASVLVLIGP